MPADGHPPQPAKDFFISYTGADRSWAEWIAWQLDAAGYKVVLQAWDFAAGTNFVSQMKDAAQSRRTISVYSGSYFKSQFSEDEWTAAFARRALIPVRIESCDIPDFLKPVVYIDLVGKDENAARDTLLNGVRQTSGKPAAAPAFPASAARSGSTAAPKRFPGKLPGIFEVPLHRNPNFTGRDEMLEDLHRRLSSGRPAALVQAISGIGGVGKTSLALEYCYRFATDYEAVCWVGAETTSTLAGDYAHLAHALQLPERDSPNQPQVIAAVRAWFDSHSDWLLVFDNAVDPASLDAYRPHSDAGRVLITSRNPVWGTVAAPLPVQQLARAESVRFLLQRTRSDETGPADTLSEMLGDLPLALSQAASYVEAKDISIADYIERLSSYSQKLLEPVKATWALSVNKLNTESPSALKLLTVCAFLAPDNIPRTLLRPQVQDDLELDDAVEALRRYGLVVTAQRSIGIHRLLQRVIRENLTPEAQRNWAIEAYNLVRRQFPVQPDDYRVWPVCAPLLPHALAVANYLDELQTALAGAAELLNDAGVFEGKRGQLQSGRALLTRALDLTIKANGPDDPNAAIFANNLGDLLTDLGELDLAIEKLQMALKIDEAARGPNHPYVAIRLTNLGSALLKKGDLKTSFEYATRALAIDEKALAPNDPRIAVDCQLLGMVLYTRNQPGDLAQAKQYLIRAVDIDQKELGENHPTVAARWSDLGSILAVSGEWAQAYHCFRHALEIYRKTFPPDHPYVRITERNVSEFLVFVRDALVISKNALKPDDPQVAQFAAVLQEMDQFAATLPAQPVIQAAKPQ